MAGGAAVDLKDFSTDDIYQIAVVIEDEGFKFYQKIIDASDIKRVKNEVKYLRDEEAKHKAFFNSLVKDPKASAADNKKLKSYIESEFTGPTDKLFEGGKITDPIKALEHAMFLEQQTIDFYQGLKEKQTDSGLISDLDTIISEEKNHKQKIKIILSY